MKNYTKLELGTLASVLAGAVWIGSLQGSINTLDTSEIRKQKEIALSEIKTALKTIEKKNIDLDRQYNEKIGTFEKSLNTINEKLRELDVLIEDFQRINNEDNREIIAQKRIIKIEKTLDLIKEEVSYKNNVYLELKKVFDSETSDLDQFTRLKQAQSELDKSIEKMEAKKMELHRIKGDNRATRAETEVNLKTDPINSQSQLYKINIKTKPNNALIRILNLNTEYKEGMVFPAGVYKISISKFKYGTKEIDVEIIDHDVDITENLTKVYYPLYVNTIPNGAKIRITSNMQKYKRGMYVEPGNYRIKVSKSGYFSKAEWVTVEDGTTTVTFKLNKKK